MFFIFFFSSRYTRPSFLKWEKKNPTILCGHNNESEAISSWVWLKQKNLEASKDWWLTCNLLSCCKLSKPSVFLQRTPILNLFNKHYKSKFAVMILLRIFNCNNSFIIGLYVWHSYKLILACCSRCCGEKWVKLCKCTDPFFLVILNFLSFFHDCEQEHRNKIVSFLNNKFVQKGDLVTRTPSSHILTFYT